MADKKFGDEITHEALAKMKKAHKAKHPGTTEHVTFSTASLKAIINKYEYIQVHFCISEEGYETVSFVGTDASTATAAKANDVSTDPPVNRGQPCPPLC
jgi:hypothetical protein